MPFPTSHGAFACCGFKTSVQVIKKKGGGRNVIFGEAKNTSGSLACKS